MKTPRVHLMRQLFVLALVVAGAAFILWPRSIPDCSRSGGDGGVHVTLPSSFDRLGVVLTCTR